MPDARQRKKIKGFKLPPDVENYLKGTAESPILSEQWPTGFEHLSPQSIWALWSETNPRKMYQAQLGDFLRENWGKTLHDPELGQDVTVDKDFITDLNKTIEAYNSIDWPIEAMPFYQEVRSTIGSNFWNLYNQKVNEELILMADEQQQAEQAQQRLFQRYRPYSKEARAEGELGTTEAQFQRGELLDKYNAFSPEGRKNLVEAVAQGLITPQEAFGPDSAWSKWHQGLSGQQPAGAPGTLAGALGQAIGQEKVGASNQANRVNMGAKLAAQNPAWWKAFLATPEGANAAGSANPAPSRGIEGLYAGAPGSSMLGNAFAGNAEAKLSIGSLTGSQALSGNALASSLFIDWLTNNPEYKAEQQTKIAGYMTDYPGFYSKYQEYLSQEGTPKEGWQGFEAWAQARPEYLLLQEQKRRQTAQAVPRLAPSARIG